MKRPKLRFAPLHLAPSSPLLALLSLLALGLAAGLALAASRFLRLVEFQVAQIGGAHQLSSTLTGSRGRGPRSFCRRGRRSFCRRGCPRSCCRSGCPLVIPLGIVSLLAASKSQGVLKASKSLAEATQNGRHFYYNAIFYWRAK